MTVELILGDCLEVMKGMDDKSVDAILTDLPYGTTACSWDEIIPFEPMWEQVKRICKGVFVTTSSQPFTSKLVMSNLDWFKYEWIWHKAVGSNFATLNYNPMKEHENIVVFGENGTYNPQMQRRRGSGLNRINYNYNASETKTGEANGALENINRTGNYAKMRNPSSVQYFNNRDDERGLHPTQKPAALFQYLVRTYTNEGDIVYDMCIGSGTTGVACVKENRNFIGSEIDPDYFAIAERRIKEAQMQPRLL